MHCASILSSAAEPVVDAGAVVAGVGAAGGAGGGGGGGVAAAVPAGTMTLPAPLGPEAKVPPEVAVDVELAAAVGAGVAGAAGGATATAGGATAVDAAVAVVGAFVGGVVAELELFVDDAVILIGELELVVAGEGLVPLILPG